MNNGLDIERWNDEQILARAQQIALRRLARGESISDKASASAAVRTLLQGLDREVFMVLFLDCNHRILAHEVLFMGTLTAATVYPREIVKAALNHNAHAIMLAHNHPSGVAEPSAADRAVTQRIFDAAALFEIKVLDHLVIGEIVVSFAERGLL